MTQIACECGAVLKVYGLDPAEHNLYIETFRMFHNSTGHTEVTVAEARDIRAGKAKKYRESQ